MMFEPSYKVERLTFYDLEHFLNNYHKVFPHYHLYQIVPGHGYDGAFAVVILEHDDEKGGAE